MLVTRLGMFDRASDYAIGSYGISPADCVICHPHVRQILRWRSIDRVEHMS